MDVSYYQGNIDWQAVRADGVEFAFVRVSDGIGVEDSKFDQNWAGARDAGILRGAYQFFRPNQDPIAQADLLLSRIGTLEAGDLPPVIDVEAAGGLAPSAVEGAVRTWVDRVTAALGRSPIIYTGFYFWRDSVGAPDLTSSPLWHAQYTSAECPNIAPPWGDWAFWQYTSTGRVAGISGNVDTNRFNGTRTQLEALTGEPRLCGTIDPAGGVIDDGDPCFAAGGPAASLRHVATAGEGGDLIWTYATDDAVESNFAQWNLAFAEAGRYRLEVATPAAFAETHSARYVVHVAGQDHELAIDQTAVDGYQSLGDFDVAAGGDQYVHLGDDTGEPLADKVQIVFDSLRVTRLSPEDLGPDPDQPGPDDAAGGCSAGTGTRAWLGLVVLAFAWARRRRRRRDERDDAIPWYA